MNKKDKANDLSLEKLYEICHELIMVIKKLNNELDCVEYKSVSEEDYQNLCEIVEGILHNLDKTSEETHEIWMKQKEKNGWKYGKITDRKNKIHNCLIPYKDLPFLQKIKDKIILETVKMYKNESISENNLLKYADLKLDLSVD